MSDPHTQNVLNLFPRARFARPSHHLSRRRMARAIGIFSLMAIILLVGPNTPLAMGLGITTPTAHAQGLTSQRSASQSTPNRFDPHSAASSVLHFPPAQKGSPHSGPPQPIKHGGFQPRGLGSAALDPVQGARFVTSDGKFEVDVPAGAITAADVSAAGGKLSLQVSQIAPPSGSNAGGSRIVSFGTFLLQVVDAHGVLAKQGLRKPVTVQLDYGKAAGVDLLHAFVVINGGVPTDLTTAIAATTTAAVTSAQTTSPQLVNASSLALGTYGTQNTTLDGKHHKLSVTAALSSPSSSMTWNTTGPIAFFGKPDIFNADLSAGSLSASLPVDVPAGPGGLTPPISLSYSSAGVSEDHSVQSAASWVGEGWNLSLGSINWSERDGTAGCVAAGTCSPVWESQWQLSDPYGTGSELVPPNLGVSTYIDDTPNTYYNSGTYYNLPSIWHTASESYAKVVDYRSSINFGNNINPPCFRVWLKNGLMEEFGCTTNSLLEYVANPGVDGVAEYYISGWLLDLITDPRGNQIHITYQRDTETVGGLSYPRDAELATIEWDSPTCRNAQTACSTTGTAPNLWQPLMRVNFSAGHTPTRLASTPSGCNTGSNLRCDDPKDLSSTICPTGSTTDGLSAPSVQNTFVLNDLYVQVNNSTSGGGTYNANSWNSLKDYQLSYEQSAPGQITDPTTGKCESTAGYMDLTQIKVVGDDSTTAQPTRTFSYTSVPEYYEDDTFHPNPTTNCGPSWNTGSSYDSNQCIVWSTTYDGNSRYLSMASNGMGLAQTFSWQNARSNTHGANNGVNGDPMACNSSGNPIGSYPCDEADDQSWSHVVMTQQQGQVIRAASGGNQTVTSTTAYTYALTTNWPGKECGDCSQGMYWGNENENDYLDYYNAKYMGFAQASVSKPDGSLEVHKFDATEGWGVYDNTQITNCVPNMQPAGPTPCPNVPWWHLTNVGHGHEYEVDNYDTNGTTLLKKATTQYQAVCPPSGVSGSGTLTGYGNFNGNLVSELDHGNPVAVCDVQKTRTDDYTYDGANPSTVPDLTTTYSYDNFGRVTSSTSSSNNGGATGSPTSIVDQTAYISNNAVSTSQTSATGTYLIDFVAYTAVENSSDTTRYSCSEKAYDGQAYTTGQSSGLTLGELTSDSKFYSNCGTSSNGWAPSGPITTTYTYDQFGNHLTTDDPDANAGISGHKGCTVGSTTYSICSAYDTIFDALPTTRANALNQAQSTGYASTPAAANGFGLWPISTTDVDNQTTSYSYDALQRMTSETLPGETNAPSMSWTYTDWCTGTAAQTPCVEVDQTQRINSTTTVTSRAFYDGYGNLVETRGQGPNGQDVVRYRYNDSSGRDVFDSISYFVTAYTGSAGSAAFSVPDSTQPGTKMADSTSTPAWYGYDGLGRAIKVQDALSNTTTTSYTVVCNAAGTADSACYEQKLVTDALSHQSGQLTDALGRETYDQRYTGNSGATYALYATTKYTYDYNGNLTQILHPDGTSKTTSQYDPAGRVTSVTDPDTGTMTTTYDADSNAVESVDSRGSTGTAYAGYDGLDRQVWRNTTNSPTGAYLTYTYDGTANGNMGVGRLTSETFTGGPSNTLSGSNSYVYDARGQQTSQMLTVGSTHYTTQTSYDDAGTMLTQTYPDGEVVTNSYMAQDWLSGVATQQAGVTTTLLSNASYSGFGGPEQLLSSATLGTITNTQEDNFTRANQTGWGTSTNGDGVTNTAWGLDANGSLSYVTINNNLGVFGYQGSKGVVGIAAFGSTTHDGGDALAKWSISAVGNGVPFISLNACADKSCYYGARVNTNKGTVELAKESGGRTTIETSSSFTAAANTAYWTRLNVNHSGSSTVVSLKVWQDGTAEPTAWTLSWTDSSPLAVGYVGAGGTWAASGSGEAISYACYAYSATPAVPAAACGEGKYTYSASYDALLRATDLKWTRASDGATLFEQARTFDGASNVTTASTSLQAGTDNQAFCYDEQNRLTWASSASGAAPCGGTNTAGTLTAAQYTQSFTYDNLGRLTSGPLGSYSYGPGMQASTNPSPLHGVLAIGTSYSAKYDGAGNMTCRAPTSTMTCAGGTPTGAQLSYDNEGRLSAWQNAPSSPSTTAADLYDGEGNRVEQQVTSSGSTTTTVYISNLEVAQTSGSTTTTTTYYYAGKTRIAEAVNGSFSYLTSDGLGSATLAQGASGTSQASRLYAPYGSVRYSGGTLPTDYGYTGQHSDSATGLDYYAARYYDPAAAQFTTADIVLPGGGYDPWGLSRYAYAEGNPVDRTDPTGHDPVANASTIVGWAVGIFRPMFTKLADGLHAAAGGFQDARAYLVDLNKEFGPGGRIPDWQIGLRQSLNQAGNELEGRAAQIEKVSNGLEDFGNAVAAAAAVYDYTTTSNAQWNRDSSYSFGLRAARSQTAGLVHTALDLGVAFTAQYLGDAVGEVGGTVAGAVLGGLLGGVIGTFIEPGGGTIAGAYLGAELGADIGAGVGAFVGGAALTWWATNDPTISEGVDNATSSAVSAVTNAWDTVSSWL